MGVVVLPVHKEVERWLDTPHPTSHVALPHLILLPAQLAVLTPGSRRSLPPPPPPPSLFSLCPLHPAHPVVSAVQSLSITVLAQLLNLYKPTICCTLCVSLVTCAVCQTSKQAVICLVHWQVCCSVFLAVTHTSQSSIKCHSHKSAYCPPNHEAAYPYENDPPCTCT